MEIVFNEPLKDFNVTRLSSSELDIFIVPIIPTRVKYDDKVEYRNLSMLNFTWEAINLEENVLQIKVNFSNEV